MKNNIIRLAKSELEIGSHSKTFRQKDMRVKNQGPFRESLPDIMGPKPNFKS